MAAASDGVAFIHFDVRSSRASFEALEVAVAGEPRIRLVEKRAAGAWGSFGLVEAPLNALAQIEAEGLEPDYVILLSGACLPCQPIASLERYLAENAGREFIESEDESWITGGWRAERWRYWHWFDHKTQRPLEWLSARIQKYLRIRRSFPAGLEPRFGSQWWTLSWPVIQAILADIRRQPKRLDFFRTVWIPDEIVFQTYVNAIVSREAIAGFGLTHFQFTNRGKPVVFHEDHADYVQTLGRFFVRKVSPEAGGLRAACLAQAAAPDDGREFGDPRARRGDYRLKIAAQTHYPAPGQIFYRDQFSDMTGQVLDRAKDPYVVLIGPPAMTERLAADLPETRFTVFGEVFEPRKVGLGPGRDSFHGLRRGDVAIRDMHPALWLVRLRARSEGVPVVTWSPLARRELLVEVLRDPRALVIALPPSSGDPDRDRATLLAHCLGSEAMHAAAAPLGVAPDRLQTALGDGAGARDPDLALWLVSPVGQTSLRRPDIALPWSVQPGPEIRSQRREELDRALEACRFRDAPWFADLAATLGRAAGRLAAPVPAPVVMEDAS